MKVIFMGTPAFAVPSLRELTEAGHDVKLVFTKPDKPRDRGQKIQKTPVKEFAEAHNIEVFQPVSLKKGEDGARSLEIIKAVNPDVIAVAAYGQILPNEILEYPKYGCINVHASLLPEYRGAAPINHVIMDGRTDSGITIMYMAEGIDTGDIIVKEKVEIGDKMTATELHDILSETGAKLLVSALSLIENGNAVRIAQNNNEACHAPMITKEMCRIDWHCSALDVYNKIRGLSEAPGAYTFLGGKRLKIYFAELSDKGSKGGKPGDIIGRDFTVVCGDGKSLTLTDIQLEGGKRMKTETFLLGRKLDVPSVG